jgi:hypothetical protein
MGPLPISELTKDKAAINILTLIKTSLFVFIEGADYFRSEFTQVLCSIMWRTLQLILPIEAELEYLLK